MHSSRIPKNRFTSQTKSVRQAVYITLVYNQQQQQKTSISCKFRWLLGLSIEFGRLQIDYWRQFRVIDEKRSRKIAIILDEKQLC